MAKRAVPAAAVADAHSGLLPEKALVCIAPSLHRHKSLEIFEQCRLWQRNLQLRWQIPLLFAEKSLKTVCFEFMIKKQVLKQTPSVCLRAF
jgi:hypothetical protein